MHDHWIADRMKQIEVSGIRKVFELAAHLKDPVNLSIGQPHFPVPASVNVHFHQFNQRPRDERFVCND